MCVESGNAVVIARTIAYPSSDPITIFFQTTVTQFHFEMVEKKIICFEVTIVVNVNWTQENRWFLCR